MYLLMKRSLPNGKAGMNDHSGYRLTAASGGQQETVKLLAAFRIEDTEYDEGNSRHLESMGVGASFWGRPGDHGSRSNQIPIPMARQSLEPCQLTGRRDPSRCGLWRWIDCVWRSRKSQYQSSHL